MSPREERWADEWFFLGPEQRHLRYRLAHTSAKFSLLIFLPVCMSGWLILTLNMHSFHVSYAVLSYFAGWFTGRTWRIHWYHRDHANWMRRNMNS